MLRVTLLPRTSHLGRHASLWLLSGRSFAATAMPAAPRLKYLDSEFEKVDKSKAKLAALVPSLKPLLPTKARARATVKSSTPEKLMKTADYVMYALSVEGQPETARSVFEQVSESLLPTVSFFGPEATTRMPISSTDTNIDKHSQECLKFMCRGHQHLVRGFIFSGRDQDYVQAAFHSNLLYNLEAHLGLEESQKLQKVPWNPETYAIKYEHYFRFITDNFGDVSISQVYKVMCADGVRPRRSMLEAYLKWCVGHSSFFMAEKFLAQLYKDYGHYPHPNAARIMLKYLRDHRLPFEAQRLFDQYHKWGTTMDVGHCNLLVSAYFRDIDPVGGIEAYKQMRSMGIDPDTAFYDMLLNSYFDLKALNNPTSSLLTLLESLQNEVGPSQQSFLLMMKMYASAEKYDRARDIMKQLMESPSFKPTRNVFNSYLEVIANDPKTSEISDVITQMKKYNVSPNEDTYIWIMTANIKAGNSKALNNVITTMTKAGIRPTHAGLTRVLHMFSTKSGNENVVRQITDRLHNIKAASSRHKEPTFEVGALRADEPAHAQHIMDRTHALDHRPAFNSYRHLMSYYANNRDMQGVYDTFNAIRSRYTQLPAQMYAEVITNSTTPDFESPYDSFGRMLDLMKEDGVSPNIHFWISAMIKLSGARATEAMKVCFQLAKEDDVQLNARFYGLYIAGMLVQNDLELAFDTLLEMKELKIKPTTNIVNMMIRHFMQQEKVHGAAYLLVLAKEFDIIPNKDTAELTTAVQQVLELTAASPEVLEEIQRGDRERIFADAQEDIVKEATTLNENMGVVLHSQAYRADPRA